MSAVAKPRRVQMVRDLWPHCYRVGVQVPHLSNGYYIWSEDLWRWTCAACEPYTTYCWKCHTTGGTRFEAGVPTCRHCGWVMRWADVKTRKEA